MAGNITSLHYPGNYSDNLDCRYSIDLRNAGASSASLTFRDFQTSYLFKLAVYCTFKQEGTYNQFNVQKPVVHHLIQLLILFFFAIFFLFFDAERRHSFFLLVTRNKNSPHNGKLTFENSFMTMTAIAIQFAIRCILKTKSY